VDSLHTAKIAGALGLALVGVLSLFWALRGTGNELAVPIDRDPGKFPTVGIPNIAGFYLLTGWLFSLVPMFAKIPGATLADSVVTFGLAGVLFAGVLRLHAMTRSFSLGRLLRGPHPVSELALLVIALGFGSALLLAVVGDVRTFTNSIASVNDGNNPQPFGLILVFGSLAVALAVELIWYQWSRTEEYVAIAHEVAQEAISGILQDRRGVYALGLYWSLSETAAVESLETIRPLLITAPLTNETPRPDARVVVDLLLRHGFLVSVTAGGFRRNPHFFREHREEIAKLRSAFDETDGLGIDQVALLLEARGSRWSDFVLPTPLRTYIASFDKERDEVLIRLLDDTLADVRAHSTNERDALLAEYLFERYWRGKTVVAIAAELGYSREHLTRLARTQGIPLFKEYLTRRMRSGL
jgi:hypothetical protein